MNYRLLSQMRRIIIHNINNINFSIIYYDPILLKLCHLLALSVTHPLTYTLKKEILPKIIDEIELLIHIMCNINNGDKFIYFMNELLKYQYSFRQQLVQLEKNPKPTLPDPLVSKTKVLKHEKYAELPKCKITEKPRNLQDISISHENEAYRISKRKCNDYYLPLLTHITRILNIKEDDQLFKEKKARAFKLYKLYNPEEYQVVDRIRFEGFIESSSFKEANIALKSKDFRTAIVKFKDAYYDTIAQRTPNMWAYVNIRCIKILIALLKATIGFKSQKINQIEGSINFFKDNIEVTTSNAECFVIAYIIHQCYSEQLNMIVAGILGHELSQHLIL